jgi:hypothetical protein
MLNISDRFSYFFVTMFHREADIALFVTCFDIVVCLDDMFKLINPVYDRLYLPASISSLRKSRLSSFSPPFESA